LWLVSRTLATGITQVLTFVAEEPNWLLSLKFSNRVPYSKSFSHTVKQSAWKHFRWIQGHFLPFCSVHGMDVQFFGGVARMPAGPAIVAIRAGIPLVTAFVSYTEAGIHVNLQEIEIPQSGDEESRIKATVQLCADNFAEGIKEFPHDWHMMQRIWVDRDFVERS
jgi:hypothetical protein